jgi:hypothetical protein
MLPGGVDEHQLTTLVQRCGAGFNDLAAQQ